MKPVVIPLVRGVNLLQFRIEEPSLHFVYELDNATLQVCNFSLNLESSENVAIDGKSIGDLIVECRLEPFQRHMLCRVRAHDIYQGWSIRSRWSFQMSDPDPRILQEYIDREHARVEREIRDAFRSYGTLDLDHSDLPSLMTKLASEKVPFIDLEFPPTSRALYPDPSHVPTHRFIEWRRPEDFCSEESECLEEEPIVCVPEVFVDGVDVDDVRQGCLGDCWLVCAIASLAERPELIERIFCDHSKMWNSAGIFRLSFFKNGEPFSVTVDSYIPCFPNAGPLYTRARKGTEMWPCLIEKAFAKAHGNFCALRGGWAFEAFADLTGAPILRLNFSDPEVISTIEDGDLFEQLQKFDSQGYMMAASTPGEDRWTEISGIPDSNEEQTGLVPGHAYSLISVHRTSTGARLLRIRNPWSLFEWKGAWSDHAPEWTEKLRAEVGAVIADDGTFFMCFEDFVKFFASVCICEISDWHVDRFKFHLERTKGSENQNQGSSDSCDDGIFVRPDQHYRVYVEAGGTKIFIGLHQEDQRIQGGADHRPYVDLGYVIIDETTEGSPVFFDALIPEIDRQVFGEFILPGGVYRIVPISIGCRLQPDLSHQEVFERCSLLHPHDGLLAPDVVTTVWDIFRRYDLDMDELMSHDEFLSFCRDAVLPNPPSSVEWVRMCARYSGSDDCLCRRGFVEWFQSFVSSSDPSAVWSALERLGYDQTLFSFRKRTIILSSHSLYPVHWTVVQNEDSVTDRLALEMLIREKGSPHDSNASVKIWTLLSPKAYGYSFAVESSLPQTMGFTLDCSSSKSVHSSLGRCSIHDDSSVLSENEECLAIKRSIRSGDFRFFFHTQATRSAQSFSCGWSASWEYGAE